MRSNYPVDIHVMHMQYSNYRIIITWCRACSTCNIRTIISSSPGAVPVAHAIFELSYHHHRVPFLLHMQYSNYNIIITGCRSYCTCNIRTIISSSPGAVPVAHAIFELSYHHHRVPFLLHMQYSNYHIIITGCRSCCLYST